MAKSWYEILGQEIQSPYIKGLKEFLTVERRRAVYPPEEEVFKAFSYTPYSEVKVVIMGQDPYHGPGQAHGLSFSVPEGVLPPPSLKNIFKELETDLGLPPPKTGCLIPWAKQGVLLLNATLTVREGEPQSHKGKGWEQFTDAVIRKLAERKKPIVFLLWGRSAKEKCSQVLSGTEHVILTAPHPSPLSAHQGFLGCRHFSQANAYLVKAGLSPIDWSL